MLIYKKKPFLTYTYSSKHKYESGTGWPSFYQAAISENVATNIDRKYGLTRTEVHCAKVCIIYKTRFT